MAQLQQGLGGRGQGTRLAMKEKGDSDLKQHLSEARADINGACIGSESEASLNSVCGWTAAALTLSHAENPHGLSSSSTAPHWGQFAGGGRRIHSHLKGTEPAQT